MKQKQKVVKSERGAVKALCEAVIETAVDDYIYGAGSRKEDAIAFFKSGRDFEFYAQMASVECVERAEEVRSIVLGSSPVFGEKIRRRERPQNLNF